MIGMNGMFSRAVSVFVVLSLLLTMLTACGGSGGGTGDGVAPTEETTQGTAGAPIVISFAVDGGCVTFEDASGKSTQQLLEQAGITLNDGDMLSVVPEQSFPGNLAFQVIRQHTVSVLVIEEDPAQSVRHTAVLMEGTVADAIAAVGVELTEESSINYTLNTPLADGMEILIRGNSLTEVPIVPVPTEPVDPTDPSDPTEPTDPGTEQPGKTIVSIEIYEDCDGSGHGIKVITYSDGTQEEVIF